MRAARKNSKIEAPLLCCFEFSKEATHKRLLFLLVNLIVLNTITMDRGRKAMPVQNKACMERHVQRCQERHKQKVQHSESRFDLRILYTPVFPPANMSSFGICFIPIVFLASKDEE